MIRAGHPRDQAIAAAYRMSRQRAAEGGMMRPPIMPYASRADVREEETPFHGFINTAVPGRTDRHNMDVVAGSYVLPADLVSGLGEGNSLAGAHVVGKMLSSGPYGIPMPRGGHGGRGAPPAPHPAPEGTQSVHLAEGGKTEQVPIVAAGGEIVLTPAQVMQFLRAAKIPFRNLKDAHDILDEFVRAQRKKLIKTLSKLPGPAK